MCLGVPRHPTNDGDFILSALDPVASRHDILLDLISDVSEEDPFAALRMLQICGVNRLGHILSVVPPELPADFLLSAGCSHHGDIRSHTRPTG